jgi:hypothetical protein
MMVQKWTVRITWLIPFILVYLFAGYLTPYNWYVDVTKYEVIEPVCVGEDVLTYHTERTSRWGIQGETWGQVIQFEDQKKIETTIIRGTVSSPVGFAYEENTIDATFQTRWDETFSHPGTYGVNEWITIYPLPLIKLTKFISAEDNKFNVIICDQ